MPLMGNKQDGQIRQVHWGNFLTMVMHCYHVFFLFSFFIPSSIAFVHSQLNIDDLYSGGSQWIAGCDALACAVCVFVFSGHLVPWNSSFFFMFYMCLFSSKHWPLEVLRCVEDLLSGSGWFQLFHFTLLLGSRKLSNWVWFCYQSFGNIPPLFFFFLGERSGGVGWFDMLAYKFVHSMTLHRIFHM